MNELIANHQMSLGEKDKKLVDYQKQVDVLHSAETMLTKQIEEQKAKNNVSKCLLSSSFSFPSFEYT